MDDTLGFNEQEKKSDDWIFGDTEDSTISVSSTSRALQQNHDLHVISKNEIQSDRPMIHATKWEVLAYYRGFATGPTKTQFLCMQQENFKTYLWFYLSNVLCKTLTTTYIYVFFSVYAPDSHFFISKMQPIAYGSTIAFIITAILQLVVFIHNTTVYLDYLIQGVLFKSPLNSFIHLCAVYFETGFKHYPSYGQELIELLQITDIDLLSESTTAPPVIHVLSSRSIREIKPIQDSSLIVTSNAIFNIFRGFVSLMEVLIIFYMYPMGRLVDDLTFFSGVRPTKLRVITFWITPVFYTIKIYIMMEGYFGVSSLAYLSEDYPFYGELIYFLAIPMVLGALYAIYKYVFKFKMGFQQLFKPLPNWGPRDFLIRRLRKLYDSRVYIGSRAPRELSSYLFEKADLNAYKLDIRYDTISRRSTRGEVHLEHEKHV
ncbi:uncharacterized protein LOC123700595 [Colias croceus]|uniref:uncharacterized protein LOC123700595 n=1 Tax=Colias crocea TaxID=72248 RepID=UPI001E27E488|nr:uncharacterized protein LOC123700595 [Colias croceus]